MLRSHFRVSLSRRLTPLLSSSYISHRNNSSSSSSLRIDPFPPRHIGPSDADLPEMLASVGMGSLDELSRKTVPGNVFIPNGVPIREGMMEPKSEAETLASLKEMADKNVPKKPMMGEGYFGTYTPAAIRRNILENPAWYTPYTPYQAEIAQGRLEMLMNFQTMITDMTGLAASNASLLDEASAAAEAMSLCFSGLKKGSNTFFVSDRCNRQTIATLKTRAAALDIDIQVGDEAQWDFKSNPVAGALFQYPDRRGGIQQNISERVKAVKETGGLAVCASDLLSLALVQAPGELGFDVCVGTSQRFGVPMAFGGPHAAFIALSSPLVRRMPGRIIGLSVDSRGNPAYRMTLQAREQHIRKDKATSNICTAQALLANIAAAYAIHHGPTGIKKIAERTHLLARVIDHNAKLCNYETTNELFFDTVSIKCPGKAGEIRSALGKKRIQVRAEGADLITISCDETTQLSDVEAIVETLSSFSGTTTLPKDLLSSVPESALKASSLSRTTPFLTHSVFNSHQSETSLMRYLHGLTRKDLGLQNNMIPLGSCTMKLNAAAEMLPITWAGFSNVHPFADPEDVTGYGEMVTRLEKDLASLTGFEAVSFQPNAGSQGEYAGLLCIRNYLLGQGQPQRNVCLIPVSAHGTNPASAVIAGMKVVWVQTTPSGSLDMADFEQKLETHADTLGALMITYPSTYGVYDTNIVQVIEAVHNKGGLVYMDGANMNAQVGLCNPGGMGADVCHLNLHKTFAIPHGGGGPGMGPICVNKKLAPYLPTHPFTPSGHGFPERESLIPTDTPSTLASTPFSSTGILPITYMYINMMSGEGLKKATQMAVLNANYMASKLRSHYPVKFKCPDGFVAHEFILHMGAFVKSADVTVTDIAKRLIDFGFHPPTLSWPVPNILMVEPTESESKETLDRFCDAMIHIRQEIRNIEEGTWDRSNNPLKNAPHPLDLVTADKWDLPYSREEAAYPLAWVRENKFWPTVSRIDDVHGDRHLVLKRE